MAEPTTRTGRPRDARADTAIVQATVELLTEQGYNRLSVDAVARRAGVARATIYRRWPSKAHLIHEAVFPATEPAPWSEDGPLADDLRTFAQGALAFFALPEVTAAVPGLMAEFRDDASLRDLLAERLGTRARASFRALVERAEARGEARAGVDADVVFDAMVGGLVFGLIVSGHAHEPGFADQLADLMLKGVQA